MAHRKSGDHFAGSEPLSVSMLRLFLVLGNLPLIFLVFIGVAWHWQSVLLIEPATEVDEFAAATAKRHRVRGLRIELFAANRAPQSSHHPSDRTGFARLSTFSSETTQIMHKPGTAELGPLPKHGHAVANAQLRGPPGPHLPVATCVGAVPPAQVSDAVPKWVYSLHRDRCS